MHSKQTDYVNAQFDDAQENVKNLFDIIKGADTGTGECPIACKFESDHKGFFGNSYVYFVYIWRKKNQIKMVAGCVLWTAAAWWGFESNINVLSWGIPRRSYQRQDGDASMTLEPRNGGVFIDVNRGAFSDNPCFIIQDSWSV